MKQKILHMLENRNFFVTSCKYVNTMYQAIKKSLPILRRNFRQIELMRNKTKFLLNTERKIVETIVSSLAIEYEFEILYEGGPKIENKTHWILDPIDGSRNFMSGISIFTINLALMQNNDIVAGIIYDPVANLCYWASKNKGAYVERKKISVSSNQNILVIKENINTDNRIRSLGSSGLEMAYVAEGKYSGFFTRNPNIWDIASGKIIIQEANGYIKQNESYILCGEEEFCKSFLNNFNKSNNL